MQFDARTFSNNKYGHTVSSYDPGGEKVTGLDEELEYECPECGASLPAGAKFCTTCKAEIDWGGGENVTVDEILEDITKSMEPDEEADAEGPEAPEEAIEEESKAPEEAVEEEPVLPEEEVPEELEELPPEEILEEVPPVAYKGPKLYAGLFSVVGLAFIVLTVAALIATILALRWDTWINGAAEESIGDRQVLFVYLGVAGTVVCAIVSVVDVLRNRKGQRG